MLQWISENGQIDFGNLAVGAATALVALITLYVSNKNIRESRSIADINFQILERSMRAEGKRRLAEKRIWIEDIRKDLARFFSLISNERNTPERFDDLNTIVSLIILRLTPGKAEHISLRSALKEAHEFEGEFSELVPKMHAAMEIAQQILREEWRTVKAELLAEEERT